MSKESVSEVPVERRKLPRQQVYVVAVGHGAGKEFQCVIKNFSPEGVLFAPTEAWSGMENDLKIQSTVRLVFEYSLRKYDLEFKILRVLDVDGASVFAGEIVAPPA